jgi:hypothetical protein
VEKPSWKRPCWLRPRNPKRAGESQSEPQLGNTISLHTSSSILVPSSCSTIRLEPFVAARLETRQSAECYCRSRSLRQRNTQNSSDKLSPQLRTELQQSVPRTPPASEIASLLHAIDEGDMLVQIRRVLISSGDQKPRHATTSLCWTP